MAEKLSLRTNANGDIYVYIEDSSGASLAFGADSANGVVALNTSPTPNVEPLESTANMTIDPSANGDILFRPHGSGKSEFNTGDVQITAGDANIIAGDVNLSAGNVNLPATAAGLTEGAISVDGSVRLHAYGTENLFLGNNVGNTTLDTINAQQNYVIGLNCLQNVTTGAGNDCHGWNAGSSITTGGRNQCIGFQAGTNLTIGTENVMIGYHAGINAVTGNNNIIVGSDAGSNYTGAESINIVIGNAGSVGESNTIRLGTSGTHTKSYLAGSHGVTPSGASQQIMIMDSSGQMGTTSGGAFTTNTYNTGSGSAVPSAGAITISGSGGTSTSASGSTVTITSTAPAMVLLQTQTASSSATLTISTGISSTYSCYLLAYNNIITDSNANPFFRMEFSTDGGSTWLNSNYQGASNHTSWNLSVWTATTSTTVARLSNAIALGTGNGLSGFAYIHGLGSAVNVFWEGRTFLQNTQCICYGYNSGTTAVNALRFSYSAGNMTSGTISLYGLTK